MAKRVHRYVSISMHHPLATLIQLERSRLMKAHSVLSCLTVAMDHMDYEDAQGQRILDYPQVIELVRDLVEESINRLDSVHIQEFFENSAIAERPRR